jgi:hypothetical protein
MSKVSSDHLYRLIKSLSVPEKRYFNLFVQQSGQSVPLYFTLFQLIDSAHTFDDALFMQKLYSKNKAETKRYPVLKAYLYDLILAALQSYDEKNSVIFRLNALLQGVSVLNKRGLHLDCTVLLQKAEKLALKYEAFSYVLEILDWRKQLAYTRADIDFLDKELQAIQLKEQEILNQQGEVLQAKQKFYQILLHVRRNAQSDNKLMMSELGNIPATSSSIHAETYHRRAQNLVYYAMKDLPAFHTSGHELIQFLEQHLYLFKENLTEYIAALSNYILASGLLNRYDQVELTLQKMSHLSPNTLDDKRKIHRQYYSNRFALCVFSGAFEDGPDLINHHKQEIIALGIPQYESDTTLVQYFLIYFGCGDFDVALDCLNEWMNQPRSVGRQDIQSLVRVLNLIIHFEQGNYQLLEYKLRGATRYLKSKKKTQELEDIFIRLIAGLIKTDRSAGMKVLFQKAQTDLASASASSEVQTLLKTFDFTSWISSKINGVSFADQVKQRFLGILDK